MADNNILEDTVGVEGYDDGDEYRVVQLSATLNSASIEQHIATIQPGSVVITRMSDRKKPKQFGLTEAEMNNLVEAWLNFKADLATLKAAKEAEKQEKFNEIWAEIARLADSIPGMEIYAKPDDTWWNYDTQEEQPYTYVKVPAIGFEQRYTLPEKTLAGVKDAIEQYNNYVQLYEKWKNDDWYGCTHKGKENGQNFLKQYREWLTEKQQETTTNDPN